jgi:hypothetical protein
MRHATLAAILSVWIFDAAFAIASEDVVIDGVDAGENLSSRLQKTHAGVWEWKLKRPMAELRDATLTVTVRDRQGNTTRVRRSFSVDVAAGKRTASLR